MLHQASVAEGQGMCDPCLYRVSVPILHQHDALRVQRDSTHQQCALLFAKDDKRRC